MQDTVLKFRWLAVALLLTGCSITTGETRTETRSIPLEGAEQARVDLEMGAGELRVSGGGSNLMEGQFAYNAEHLKPVVERQSTGGRADVKVSQSGAGSFTLGNTSSRWDVRLNDAVPIEVVARLGAGEAEMNLGSLNLRNVEVNIGAGEVRVDLRGAPKQGYGVHIKGGVGETVVYLPPVGISATASHGIGDVNVEGLERRGERWVNPGHESDPVQITVDVAGGVGEIRLIGSR